MPELPEVEAGRKVADRAARNKAIARVEVAEDPIVYENVPAETIRRALKNRTVLATHRHGKHTWFELDRRPWPLFHFGMTGAFFAYRTPEDRPRFWKIDLAFEDGTRLAMTNARRLGRIRLREDPASEDPIAGLGFDPVHALPPPKDFVDRVRRKKAVLKGLLLNQSFIAGVGNWIADEVLFQAQLDPRRSANSLSDGEARKLRAVLARVLDRAVKVDADETRFPAGWMFHRRWGKKDGQRTTRGDAVEFMTVAGRTTAWVPNVQK
ncbi:MAG: DNA-formamidopyrimidine glycosylase family protein [Myxococcota bacterium]